MAIGLVIEAVPPTSLSGAIDEHEGPAGTLGAGGGEVVEVLVVEELHAHRDEAEDVDRVGAAVEGVLAVVGDAVGSEEGDAAITGARGRRRGGGPEKVERLSQGPVALRFGVAAGPDEEDVAALDLEALALSRSLRGRRR